MPFIFQVARIIFFIFPSSLKTAELWLMNFDLFADYKLLPRKKAMEERYQNYH